MTTPPPAPDEQRMLEGFLDWFRAVAVRKVEDLSVEQATATRTPTGLTLLGVVKHLAWDERRWFSHYFVGQPAEPVTNPESFAVAPNDTVASVVTDYESACEASRATVAAASSLDAPIVIPHEVFGPVDLRWILVHMTEETARHCGHLDILREFTDGRTGD